MKEALVLLLIGWLAAVAAHAEYILWFSILDEAEVDTMFGTMTVVAYAAETGANAARIRVDPAGTFLDLYYQDEGVWVKEQGLNIADNGVSLDKGNTLAWQAASMDVYAEAGNTYVIELGRIGDDDNFVALATAEGTYADLMAGGHISTGGISTQVHTPWAPLKFNVVPEPSSGILALCGALLLMRRRTKPAQCARC